MEDRIDQLAAEVGRMQHEMRDLMEMFVYQRQQTQDQAPPALLAPPIPSALIIPLQPYEQFSS